MQVRGVRPFFSEKYDITRHPRYKYLSDADKKNTFDVDSYLSSLRRKRRRVITEDEPFDEWTFADYFKYEKESYRAIISAAVLCQWIAEHDTPPTDGEAEELAREIDRRLCEAWGEIFSLAVLEWRDDQ